MKKTNKFLSLLAIAAAFVGCTADEVLKSEIDKQNLVETKVAISNVSVSEITFSSAVLAADFANVGSEVVELGFIYSQNEDMSNSTGLVYKGEIKDTTIVLPLEKLLPAPTATTYYVQAYAYVKGAPVFSDTVSFETLPAVPITKESLNNNSYVATGIVDAWEEAYDFNFTIVAYEGDADSVYICNWDPYFVSKGVTAEAGMNILAGALTISEDGSSATITCSSWQPVGPNDIAFIGYDMSANDGEGDLADAIEFTLTSYGAAGTIAPGYGAYTAAGGGFYTLFPGFDFVKK